MSRNRKRNKHSGSFKLYLVFLSSLICLVLGADGELSLALELARADPAIAPHHHSEVSSAYVMFKSQNTALDAQEVRVIVELARTQREISRGLMFRDHLNDDRGMLFLFDREQPLGFWMKNTLIPLDIIFISEALEVVSTRTRVPPCERDPCPVYRSGKPAKFVVEVNAGFVQKYGISPGNRVEISVGADKMSMP